MTEESSHIIQNYDVVINRLEEVDLEVETVRRLVEGAGLTAYIYLHDNVCLVLSEKGYNFIYNDTLDVPLHWSTNFTIEQGSDGLTCNIVYFMGEFIPANTTQGFLETHLNDAINCLKRMLS